MKILITRLVVFINLCMLCSCASIERKLYTPTQVNTPSLQKRNDHNFSASVSSPSGFDLHGSYAITNRLAILGGLFTYRSKDTEENYSIFSTDRDSALLLYRHKGFHIGAGGYFPLSKNKSSSLFLSVFGIYTGGEFKMNETLFSNANAGIPQKNFYYSDINRWALQSSLHFYSPDFHQAISVRYNYVGYANASMDYTDQEQYSYRLPPLGHSKWSSFLDFGFDTKIFFTKKESLGVQLFGVAAIRLNDEGYNFDHQAFRGGIGLVANSPFRKKK